MQILGVFLLAGGMLYGQSHPTPCGTHHVTPYQIPGISAPTPQKVANLRQRAKSSRPSQLSPSELLFQIQFHWITEDNVTQSLDVDGPLQQANEFFQKGGIQFTSYAPVNIITRPKKDSIFDLFRNKSDDLLRQKLEQPQVINVFIVPYLRGERGNQIVGFYKLGSLSIFITQDAFGDQSTFSHELGHFFGLFHTHGPSDRSLEYVDGSNSHKAGDRIADTPADPNLGQKNRALLNQCNYVGNILDKHGDPYNPPVHNIMSYAEPQCRYEFTHGQYARMRQYALYFNQELGVNPANQKIDPENLSTQLPWELTYPPTLPLVVGASKNEPQKPIIVFIYHDSLLWCRRMKEEIDTDVDTRKLLSEGYYTVGMDVTASPDPRNTFPNEGFRDRERDPLFRYLIAMTDKHLVHAPGIIILYRPKGNPYGYLKLAAFIPRYLSLQEFKGQLTRYQYVTQPQATPPPAIKIRPGSVDD